MIVCDYYYFWWKRAPIFTFVGRLLSRSSYITSATFIYILFLLRGLNRMSLTLSLLTHVHLRASRPLRSRILGCTGTARRSETPPTVLFAGSFLSLQHSFHFFFPFVSPPASFGRFLLPSFASWHFFFFVSSTSIAFLISRLLLTLVT